MRNIDLIVVHCSATSPSMDVDAELIRKWHKDRGWSDIGYHYVIKRDGEVQIGRAVERIGAHCKGHNANSIGVCLCGGVDGNGEPQNNFTEMQFAQLRILLDELEFKYPDCEILGHRDLSPDIDGDGIIEEWEWMKACPCFDVREWLQEA